MSFTKLTKTETPETFNWQDRLRLFFQKNLIWTIAVSTLISLGSIGGSMWIVWQIDRNLQNSIDQQLQIRDASSNIVHFDEILTMSAQMAASTGDKKWELRYNQYAPQLDKAIADLLKNIPTTQQTNSAQTNAANQKLVAYETEAFKLVRGGKSKEALDLLLSAEYEQQKNIYQEGIQNTLSQVKQDVNSQIQDYRQQLDRSIVLAFASFLLVAATWYVIFVTVREYIRDRQASQSELNEFQDSLLQANENLEAQIAAREVQERNILTESQLLQDDIAHILDVVSSLEEGDLTVSAEMNERVTGLIADTLNRTIESLNRIVTEVQETTVQVTNGAISLNKLAIDTATQAQSQSNSIVDIRALMQSISTLAKDSREQAIATDAAVRSVQAALESGQQEMNAMGYGIATLEQGTEQIVNRTRLLNEFVTISSRFSKQQKRTAALTKVLALNASSLCERAMKERDPAQFASIASEFAAIAKQVNDLATETNSSSISLQQSTDRIQTTTSGLSQDIYEIGNLVQKFTSEVRKSYQAFEYIETAIERVATAKEQVNTSSQEIATAIDRSLDSIESISTLATATTAKADTTQTQVRQLASLTHTLQQDIAFFQLTANPAASTATADTEIDPQPERLAVCDSNRDSTLVKEDFDIILAMPTLND